MAASSRSQRQCRLEKRLAGHALAKAPPAVRFLSKAYPMLGRPGSLFLSEGANVDDGVLDREPSRVLALITAL